MFIVDPIQVRKRYNAVTSIWPDTDIWHWETRRGLELALRRFERRNLLPIRGRMLDAGSGGENYFPEAHNRYQIDVADRLLSGKLNAVCASIECLPFAGESFDFVLCVGSVLNYSNLLEAMLELSRVIVRNGILVIDVETTNSAEYWFTEHWDKPIAFVLSEYLGEEEAIWLYSLQSIFATIEAAGMKVVDKMSLHILSVLTYRLFGDRSSWLRRLDTVMNLIPGLRNFGTNIVICCQKT